MDVEAFFQFIKVYGISTAILVFVIIWLRSILNQLFSIMFEKLREAMFQEKENAKEDKEKAEQAAALAQRKAIDQYGETLRKCRHLGELADSWKEIPQEVRTYLVGIKDEMKQEFEANERKAA